MNNQLSNDSEIELKNRLVMQKDLDELMQNTKFKNVILKGFIEKTLLEDSENLNHPDEGVRRDTLNKIMGVNELKRYFNSVTTVASIAEFDLVEEI